MTLRLGARKSPLSLVQAQWVAQQLEALGESVEIVPFITQGDRILNKPLATFGGKGLFTQEIEEALLQGRIDCAVHSLKDMPTLLPEGLCLGAIPPREDARDVWIARDSALTSLSDFPPGTRVGTSSLRRRCQLNHFFPSLNVLDLRGNVGTRLAKLARGDVDVIILALAGLKRLNLMEAATQILSIDQMLPAVAQGALGIECCTDRLDLLPLLQKLHHGPTAISVVIERAFLRALDGSCRTPIAGYASWQGDQVFFQGLVATLQGKHLSTLKAFYDPQGEVTPQDFGFQQGLALGKRHQEKKK